jgi:hypothetical protein
MNKANVLKEKAIIIDQIKCHIPQICEFFKSNLTLEQYSNNLSNFKTSPISIKRQELIKKIIELKFISLFGVEEFKKLQLKFKGGLSLNIADHHQILNHPFLISSNIVANFNKFDNNNKKDAIVVISSGDVPPNNYFSLGGFQFHNKRVPLFSVSEREFCSYYIEKREFDYIKRLKNINRWREFDKNEQNFLLSDCDFINSLDYSRCSNYIDQISLLVKNQWPLLFETKLRANLPELLYITQEELVTECLIKLLAEDNFISESLFNNQFRNKVIDNFRGIVVTWRETENKGTHFFWRKYPHENRALRMYLKDDRLIPIDNRFNNLSIPLQRDVVIGLLKNREIYPSLFLIFTVLNFYSGVKPLVGYGSLVYLDLMKKVWIKTLSDSKYESDIELIQSLDVTGFIAGLALFYKRFNNKLKTQYAYDIFYEGGITEQYLKNIFSMSFVDIMSNGVADMYGYYSSKYIPLTERIKPKINFDDLAELTYDWIK